jgi:hypothetical protein
MYARAIDTRIVAMTEKIREFLTANHFGGQVEYVFQPGDLKTPAGWVFLVVDTNDLYLQEELNDFISNQEKLDLLGSEDTATQFDFRIKTTDHRVQVPP